MITPEIAPFDYLDEFEVINRLTAIDLRREIKTAKDGAYCQQTCVQPCRLETPGCKTFPFQAWGRLCQNCLDQLRKQPTTSQGSHQFSIKIDIVAVKDRNDIFDIASRYTELKQSGHNRFKGKCPIHQEKTPSFMIDTEKQNWHCFGCNKGGDVIALVMASENVDFKTAIGKMK